MLYLFGFRSVIQHPTWWGVATVQGKGHMSAVALLNFLGRVIHEVLMPGDPKMEAPAVRLQEGPFFLSDQKFR